MRIWAVLAFAVPLVAGPARADDLQKAFDAISAALQRDGGGLVTLHSSCPKSIDNPSEFVGSSTIVFLNEADRAVLVSTGYCNGGNGSGQHLVVIQNGTATLMTDLGIQDMSFLADHMYADGNSLFLYGSRWMNYDPHCCPSRKATLEYNFKTHRHKLTNFPGGKS